jgi:UDP-glucose 4-epimerase
VEKVLITGGAGYIGSHTAVELAQAGYYIVIIDDFRTSNPESIRGIEKIIGQKVKIYQMDCATREIDKVFRKEGSFLGVVHFAALKSVNESVANPVEYYANNLGSTLNLLDMMNKYSVRHFVFSSSAAVYGNPVRIPVSEEDPLCPETPYGRTKQFCESIIRDFEAASSGFTSAILRYFNPIGAHPSGYIGEKPQGKPNNLVPCLMQTASGKRGPLTVYGNNYDTPDGTCIRDYIHVVDLARAHVAALQYLQAKKPSNIFNVGTGRGYSVLEVIKTFEDLTGIKLEFRFGPRRLGDAGKIWASCDKANSHLNWWAERSFQQALLDAWKWEQAVN